MSRNVTLTFATALVSLAFLIGSLATLSFSGVLPKESVPMDLGVSIFRSLCASVVVFLILHFFSKKMDIPDKTMNLGSRGKGWIGLFVAVALGIGIAQSLPAVSERNAQMARLTEAREAKKKAQEAEVQRFAALTPEQRAVELAQREASAKQAAENAREAKAAEDARVADVAAQESKRVFARSLAIVVARSLKESMKDPDSFEAKEVLLMEDGTACYTYRARNSFNAMLQHHAILAVTNKDIKVLTEEGDGNRFVAAWNKGCLSGGLDITWVVKTSIK